MRVVIAGFGAFPGVPFNPSAVLVRALARRRRPALADVICTTHIFATSYAAVDRDLPGLFAEKPDLILIFGVAGRRRHLSIETRARNAQSLLYPDVTGHHPASGTIERGAPAALRGDAPFALLQNAVRPSGFPARLSRDAGRYLCNYVYWRALAQARGTPTLVQFIHIPQVHIGQVHTRQVHVRQVDIRRAAMRPHRRRLRPRLAFSPLLAAAEMLLVALIAASRR